MTTKLYAMFLAIGSGFVLGLDPLTTVIADFVNWINTLP